MKALFIKILLLLLAINSYAQYEWFGNNSAPAFLDRPNPPNSYSLVPILISDSSAAPILITAVSQLAGGYEKWKAFDSDTTTLGSVWATNGTCTSGWIKVDFGASITKVVISYAIIGRGQGLGVDFKTWTFAGSNDNSVWITLDQQTNVPVWSNLERRQYNVANTAAYRYYKWYTISSACGSPYIECEQLRLYGY